MTRITDALAPYVTDETHLVFAVFLADETHGTWLLEAADKANVEVERGTYSGTACARLAEQVCRYVERTMIGESDSLLVVKLRDRVNDQLDGDHIAEWAMLAAEAYPEHEWADVVAAVQKPAPRGAFATIVANDGLDLRKTRRG